MKTSCIDPNDISLYFEGNMSDEEKGDIENHLVQCRSCLEEFMDLNEIFNDPDIMEWANEPVSDAEVARIQEGIQNKRPIKQAKLKLQKFVNTGKEKLSDMIGQMVPQPQPELSPAHAVRSNDERPTNVRLDQSLTIEGIIIKIVSQLDEGVHIELEIKNDKTINGRFIMSQVMDDPDSLDYNSSSASTENNRATFNYVFEPGHYRLVFKEIPNDEIKEYYFYITPDKGLKKDENHHSGSKPSK